MGRRMGSIDRDGKDYGLSNFEGDRKVRSSVVSILILFRYPSGVPE